MFGLLVKLLDRVGDVGLRKHPARSTMDCYQEGVTAASLVPLRLLQEAARETAEAGMTLGWPLIGESAKTPNQ